MVSMTLFSKGRLDFHIIHICSLVNSFKESTVKFPIKLHLPHTALALISCLVVRLGKNKAWHPIRVAADVLEVHKASNFKIVDYAKQETSLKVAMVLEIEDGG
jgi:hypothetical protein